MVELLGVVSKLSLVSAGYLFATSHDDLNFDPGTLLDRGVLGLVVLGFFADRLFTRGTVTRLMAERDKAESQRDDVIAEHFDRVIPLLEMTGKQVVPLLTDVADVLEEVKDTLVAVQRSLTRET